ncbi:MAG TPA: hypothetical protein VJ508_19750, partial [Saprospiraceae bacterium]|nr:hypothetical protein [Saprospiraceae bacterium]
MKPISFFLFLAMLAFAACQKDSTDPNQPSDPGTALIKTESFNGQVDTYFYDDQHRITKAIFNNHDWRDVEYGDHVFYEKEYKSDSTISYIATYELNADNLIFRYTNTSNPTYEDLRYYDADKHLKKEVSTSNGHTFLIEHYYTDGNLDSTVFHQDNQWLYTYRYTYFT